MLVAVWRNNLGEWEMSRVHAEVRDYIVVYSQRTPEVPETRLARDCSIVQARYLVAPERDGYVVWGVDETRVDGFFYTSLEEALMFFPGAVLVPSNIRVL